MIQELNLSPTGYVILLLIVVWLIIQIAKVPSKIDTEDTVKDSKDTVETPAYLAWHGRVIQIERWN